MTEHLEYASRSIRGKRKYQEDCCEFTLIPNGAEDQNSCGSANEQLLAVLADGMGGHVGGGCASRTLCAEFMDHYQAEAEAESEAERNCLLKSLVRGNEAISERVEEDNSLAGMGSTLIGCVIENDQLKWISVGDSLLYLFRDGQLRQLNENHAYSSVLRSMVASGEITELEASQHPHRNALLSAVTGGEIEKIDQPDEALELYPGDLVLIASDGLLTLSEEDIVSVLKSGSQAGIEDIVEGLIAAVQEADYPRQDNTTIMAVRYKKILPVYSIVSVLDQVPTNIAVKWIVGGMGFVIAVAVTLILASLYSNQAELEKINERGGVEEETLEQKRLKRDEIKKFPG